MFAQRPNELPQLFASGVNAHSYTNLGQIWSGPLNGKGATSQYLYCDSAKPHKLTGVFPMGTTCANRGTQTPIYESTYDGQTATYFFDTQDHLVQWIQGTDKEHLTFSSWIRHQCSKIEPNEATLVHGDLHPQNIRLLFTKQHWHIAGIIDWEHAKGWIREFDLVLLRWHLDPAGLWDAFLEGYRVEKISTERFRFLKSLN